MPDFEAAFRRIPKDVKYKHHGRQVEEGLDCIGLVMSVYEFAGLPFYDIDTPYGERDYRRKDHVRAMMKRLEAKFRLAPVVEARQCRDGDLLLLGDPGFPTHMGIYINGNVAHVAAKAVMDKGIHKLINGRLEVARVEKLWVFVSGVWRHKELFDKGEPKLA